MTDIISTLRERASRYQIKRGAELTIVAEKQDGSALSMTAELVNISVTGAKFKVGEPVVIKENLAISLETNQLQQSIVVSCEVCWVTPAARNVWSIGCSFKPPIPEKVLYELAEADILERREHPREPIAVQTTAQRELQSESNPVVLVNYSRGGFCLLSQESSKPGEHTMLRVASDEGTQEVPGKIRWQFDSQEGYIIGCEFLDTDHFNTLCELAESHRPSQEGSFPDALGPTFHKQTANANDEHCAGRRLLRDAICISTIGILALLWILSVKNWMGSTPRHVAGDSTAVSANDPQFPRQSTEVPVAFMLEVEADPAPDTEWNEELALETCEVPISEDRTADRFLSDYRTWIDNTGRFSVIARVVDVIDELVELETESGRHVSVPLRRLSQGDAQYVRLLTENVE